MLPVAPDFLVPAGSRPAGGPQKPQEPHKWMLVRKTCEARPILPFAPAIVASALQVAFSCAMDADLAELARAWASLPAEVRAGWR
jgi:hypothetical protein